jgi:hypothetical protein
MATRRHREPPLGGLLPVLLLAVAMLVLFALLIF